MSNSLAIIPRDEEELYDMLPSKQKTELDLILSYLPMILSARSTLAACKDAACRIGLRERQLYNRVCAFLNGTPDLPARSWKHLVNKAKAGAVFWQTRRIVGLPIQFQKFYQGLCERHQRTNRGGYRELMRIWSTRHDADGKRFDAIPGYSEWPKAGVCGYPAGWSERNLSNYGPDFYDNAAARIGAFAATQFRPSVRKTRTTLAFGEQVQFDDHEYNFKIHYPGQAKAMRPRGFAAAEVLTTFIEPVFKMTLWDEEEEKKRTLREIDFQWFVLRWLSTIGYRTDETGTTLMGERGLAVLREYFAEALARVTGGKVHCPMPGAVGTRAHKGQFHAQAGKSNFRRKSIVEGGWNLVDNYFDRLPAQVGKDRAHAPEEMHGREHALQTVLTAAQSLPAERARLLKLPFLTWSQFIAAVPPIFDEMMAATDHEIEGWEKLGFHVSEWRINEEMPWQPMNNLLALPEDQQGAVRALLASSSAFARTRARQLSRAEAFRAQHAEALKSGAMALLSPRKWPHVLGLKAGRPVVVNKESKFSVQVRECGATAIEYEAKVNGMPLKPGTEWLGYVNPWMPEAMVLCKPDGAVFGLCEIWKRPGMNDAEGIKRMAGRQSAWEAQRRAGLNERHADRAADIAHMEAHNAALIDPRDAAAERIERRLDREALKETEDLSALEADGPAAAEEPASGVTMQELNELG